MAADLEPCPCGTGTAYGACCKPFHDGADAPSPETLMRSRYSAYAVGNVDYLFRTWHPRTRPDDITAGGTWVGLEVLRTEGDEVEFRATFSDSSGVQVLHETSRFERRAGRWVYVDGEVS